MMQPTHTEALALLRLQIAWGADEALDEQPHDRVAAPAAAVRIVPPATVPALAGRSGQAAEAQAAGAGSLAALRAALQGFGGCALRDTASHTLFAEGDPDCGLLLIGEVPDADEDRAGRPFAGASGMLLDRMLASIGLSRDRMLIAPLIPWRPPGDRKPSPAELAACLPFLYRLVALSKPRHLVLMGARPARAMLPGETPLARLRGRWQPAAVPGLPEPIPALPMRHPASLLNTPTLRREAWQDLLLLHQALEKGSKDQSLAGSRGSAPGLQPTPSSRSRSR